MEVKYLSTMTVSALVFFTATATATATANAAEEKEVVSTVGLGYLNAMKYSGSDERDSTVVPYFNIQYDSFFLDAVDGLGLNLNLNNDIYLTQSLGYSLGRVDSNADWRAGSTKLKGMGKIKLAATSSTTIGWNIGDTLSIEGNLTAPFTDSQGVKYRAGIKYRLWSDNRNTLVFSSNANFGDSRYNNTFYGVSNTQSRNSGYSKYKASSGLYSMDADITWTHAFSDNWWSYIDVEYTHLDRNVSNSGIVYKSNQTRFAAGFLYSF